MDSHAANGNGFRNSESPVYDMEKANHMAPTASKHGEIREETAAEAAARGIAATDQYGEL